MAIYNLSLMLVFYTLFQISIIQMKTMFSFNDLSLGGVYSKVILLSFFSMAGVPPLIGFFSKIFLFILLCGSTFVLGFPFFFTTLFISLYFYIQNVRFLNASNVSNFQPIFELYIHTIPLYFYISYLTSFFLIFGAFYMDDILLVSR